MATIITAVQDVYTWDAFGTTLKSRLDIGDSSEDENLTDWLAIATEAADQFLENPFDDSTRYPSGLTIGDPRTILAGIVKFVRIIRELERRPFGLTSAKTDQLSESYAYGTRIRGGDWSPSDIVSLVSGYWWPHKLYPI